MILWGDLVNDGFSAFRSALLKENLTKETVSLYVASLKDYIEWKRNNFDGLDDASYILNLLKSNQLSIATINVRIAAINKYNSLFCNDARELKYIMFDNISYKDALSNSMVKELINNIGKLKDKLLIFFMLYMGIGLKELSLIRIEHVDYTNQCLHMGYVNMPLHQVVLPVLYDFIQKHKKVNSYLFYYRGNVSPSGLYRIIKKYDTSSIKVTPTILRNTFFNKLKENKIPNDIIYCIYSLSPDYYTAINYDEIKNVINSVRY